MNTELSKKSKKQKRFEKYFIKLMNSAVLEKPWKMRKKYRDIKLVTTKARRNYLVSEPNYHRTIFFFRKFFTHRNVYIKTDDIYKDTLRQDLILQIMKIISHYLKKKNLLD